MKQRLLSRIAATALTLCMLFAFASILAVPASAAVKITETVNLSLPKRNMSGHGYYWDNRQKTLTLDGLNIDTANEYGMKVTGGATIILKGKNYIKASKAALAIAGTVTFKGNGSLTLVSDDMGIYCYSTDDSTTIRFMSGTYNITAGGNGVHSTHTTLSFIDGVWDVTAENPEAYAINGRTLKLYGGKMTLRGAVHAALDLDVQALSLSVTAEKPALTADKTLIIKDVAISAGASADALTDTAEYAGENCVRMKSVRKDTRTSIFFGENVPRIADYGALVLFLALTAAGIGVPFLRTRQKTKRALAAAAKAEAEEEAKRKEAKRQNR